jgi:hypothetical protein
MVAPLGDEIAVLLLVAQRLDAAGIAYMLSGSLALGYYAQPRMTRDLDIVVALDVADADRLAALFADDFLCEAEAVREAARRAGMFNIIHMTRIVKVDFIVRKDTPYRREELARRRRVTIHGAPIAIVAAEDLLLSKLHWAKDSRSELQLGDARNLITAVPDLDWAYVERWAPTLSVTALLDEVRR